MRDAKQGAGRTKAWGGANALRSSVVRLAQLIGGNRLRAALRGEYPLWVISRHRVASALCPLIASKQTFIIAVGTFA